MTFEQLLNGVKAVLELEKKSISARALKLSEETGEVCEAVGCVEFASEMGYKKKTIDDVVEEAYDTVLVGLSIAMASRPDLTAEEHEKVIITKLKKWEKISIKNRKG